MKLPVTLAREGYVSFLSAEDEFGIVTLLLAEMGHLEPVYRNLIWLLL